MSTTLAPNKTALIMLVILGMLQVGWTDSWQSIQSAAATIKSIEARFVQTKHMKILAKPLRSEGMLYFRIPDSLRWEYRHPQKSIMLMHNGNLMRYIKGDDGYVEDSSPAVAMMTEVLNEMSHWLSGRFRQNPYFNASLTPQGIIELVPSDPSLAGIIQKIELTLSSQPGVIAAVKIVESPDSYTEFTFEHVNVNPPLDDGLFENI